MSRGSFRSPPSLVLLVLAGSLACGACGGGGGTDQPPKTAAKASSPHSCRDTSKVEQYDLHDEDGQEAFVPCAAEGKEDLSGLIRIDTVADGIQITIHASDDDVNLGKLGSDVKGRDAIIVYPSGRDKKGVEVPLTKSPNGYDGVKIIPFDDLEKLTDEGTKLDITIYDHDKGSAQQEEMKLAVAVSAGKSCEKAIDENPQTIDMGKKGGQKDLTDAQLGAPMKSSGFFSGCGLPDSSNAEICVAVKKGKPLGVSVKVQPQNNKVAACIDKSTRKLSFPSSEKLDVVHQKF